MPKTFSAPASMFRAQRVVVIRACVVMLGCLSLVVMESPSIAIAEDVSVQLHAAKLRSAPQQFASGTADVRFGDVLSVESRANGWCKVTLSDGRSGFIHESAVIGKKIVLSDRQATLADVAVDESQVYLAGKGFNGTVEQAFVASGQEVNYAGLDKMSSSLSVSDEDARTFIREGELKGS